MIVRSGAEAFIRDEGQRARQLTQKLNFLMFEQDLIPA